MADFAFKPYGNKPGPDDDVLASRKHASRLRDTLKSAGHNAKVERSGDGHRVYIKHPTDKDSVAYVAREEAPRLAAKDWEPHWIAK